jgi:hypothetical protein
MGEFDTKRVVDSTLWGAPVCYTPLEIFPDLISSSLVNQILPKHAL